MSRFTAQLPSTLSLSLFDALSCPHSLSHSFAPVWIAGQPANRLASRQLLRTYLLSRCRAASAAVALSKTKRQTSVTLFSCLASQLLSLSFTWFSVPSLALAHLRSLLSSRRCSLARQKLFEAFLSNKTFNAKWPSPHVNLFFFSGFSADLLANF